MGENQETEKRSDFLLFISAHFEAGALTSHPYKRESQNELMNLSKTTKKKKKRKEEPTCANTSWEGGENVGRCKINSAFILEVKHKSISFHVVTSFVIHVGACDRHEHNNILA